MLSSAGGAASDAAALVEAAMKYVLLIYSNPEFRGVWAGLSEAERGAGLGAYTGLTGDLEASGELLAAAALAPAARGRRVTARAGRR